jgi:FKBP-type peptidyl-prolyl cis-trans isomerase FkpA
MTFKLTLIAVVVAATALTACGGSDAGSSGGVAVSSPAALTKTDTVLGTGKTAATGTVASVSYTGWLYNASAADFKGTQFDKGAFSYTVGSTGVIPGFDQGVNGMKVGGKRIVLIPSSLGYGASGSGAAIPPNSGLVFEIEVTAVN